MYLRDLYTVDAKTALAALWTVLSQLSPLTFPPRPHAVPMEQIDNHISLSGKIYVTGASGSGQGSWHPSQSDSSLYFRGVAILFWTHPRPHVIFSGDYNTPPSITRERSRSALTMMECNALSLPFCPDILFLNGCGSRGLICAEPLILYLSICIKVTI